MATPTSSTRSSAVTVLDAIVSVPALFGQIVEMLNWEDALALGSVNSKYHEACQRQYNTIFLPCVLKWSCFLFLTTLVTNMRLHLNFDDPANPHNMPEILGNVEEWELGSPDDEILKLYPRRAALALNIALASYAQGSMEDCDEPDFDDAFLGKGIIDPPGYFSFAPPIIEQYQAMLPLSNEKITEYIQEILPSGRTRALLGPSLTSQVSLCAPLVKMLDHFGDLDLEPFDMAAVERARDEWDPIAADNRAREQHRAAANLG